MGLSSASILEQNQAHFLSTVVGTSRNTLALAVRAETDTQLICSLTAIKAFN